MIEALIFLGVLIVLVVAHEFGHFIVAKWHGVRVEEFGFGFPPRIWSKRRGETLYSINSIPLGGFVKLTGEEGPEPDASRRYGVNDPKSFAAKSKKARAAIMCAGVLFNVLLAIPILGFISWWGIPMAIEQAQSMKGAIEELGIFVSFVESGSPANEAGIKIGDRIKRIEKENFVLEPSSTQEVHDFIFSSKGKEITLIVLRGEKEKIIKAVPRTEHKENQGALGIIMENASILRQPWYLAILNGVRLTFIMLFNIILGLTFLFWQIITGQGGLEFVAGPVGIYVLVGDMYRLGLSFFLNFIAYLSLLLAVINILPFPALDGGRLLFLGIEAVRGKPVSYKISNITHIIGFIILIIFALFITYHDLQRFIF